MNPRARTLLLVASLALNLFLVGTIVGGLVVGQRLRPEPPQRVRMGPPIWTAGRELSPEHRAAYREVLRGEDGAVRRELRAAREARADAWRGLADTSFDAEAVRRRLAEARAQDARARAALEERIVDFAVGLPPEERARFAEGLSRPRARPPGEQRR